METFGAFRAELATLLQRLNAVEGKTLRDDELLERVRDLFRAWMTSVRQAIESGVGDKREFLKLEAELQQLALLTSKFKPIADYRKRLGRCIQFCNLLVRSIPTSVATVPGISRTSRDNLFLPEIPDLPVAMVPNALLGWRSAIEEFLREYPFDRSIFVMIRYRDHNQKLISHIKQYLDSLGFNGIVAMDHHVTDDLYNPIACLLACSRGLAVFDEPEAQQAFNPNVAYELGMMHLLGRDCRILKHSSLSVLHTDILMELYLPYSTLADVTGHLKLWLGDRND